MRSGHIAITLFGGIMATAAHGQVARSSMSVSATVATCRVAIAATDRALHVRCPQGTHYRVVRDDRQPRDGRGAISRDGGDRGGEPDAGGVSYVTVIY